MSIRFNVVLRANVVAFALSFGVAVACGAQRASQSVGASPPADSVTGLYRYSFVPANGEAITGTLQITFRNGRYFGVLTSPKVDGPLDADTVGVDGGRVFTSVFSGQFTFDFRVRGSQITDATFTKTLNGRTEHGPLAISHFFGK